MHYSLRYLLRIDDICPTMDKKVWSSIEQVVNKYQIKPIVAVIPYNLDPDLKQEKENPDFWENLAEWQRKNWCIALHGYQHVVNTNCGGKTPLTNDSEFAGLPFTTQFEKIQEGIRLFNSNGIFPKAWVSPFHSYDENTISALKEQKSSIKIICDGMGLAPYNDSGFCWIPTQIWRFRKMPFGTWTCCIHPTQVTPRSLFLLERFIANNLNRFVDTEEILNTFSSRRKNILDFYFEKIFFMLLRIKKACNKYRQPKNRLK